MLEDGMRKDLLEDQYEDNRATADEYRKQGKPEKAADYYDTCAQLLGRLAKLEDSERLAKKRTELAKNMRDAAEKLREEGHLAEDDDRRTDEASTGGSSGGDAGGSGDGGSGGGGSGGGGSGRRSGGGPDDEDDAPEAEQFLSDPPDMDFEDVGGMGELKETLRDKVIEPLENPEIYERYDLGAVDAVLLYGPPGTGKTYITEALAGELGFNFIDVEATDITSSLVGEAAQNVADLFEVARDNQPCMVFIDEIDSLMPSRSGGSQKTQSQVQMVSQFLEDMTAIRGEDVIIVGATNLPDEVDDAALSRFVDRIEVPPPDATARAAILRVHLRERPAMIDEIHWDRIKKLTEGYSARDLENVAKDAARKAVEEARENDEIRQITDEHLEAAIEETESSLEDADYEGYV